MPRSSSSPPAQSAAATAAAETPTVRPELSGLVGITGQARVTSVLMAALRHGRPGHAYLFVLNHNRTPVHVSLPAPMENILTGETCERTVVLPPLEIAILMTT